METVPADIKQDGDDGPFPLTLLGLMQFLRGFSSVLSVWHLSKTSEANHPMASALTLPLMILPADCCLVTVTFYSGVPGLQPQTRFLVTKHQRYNESEY